MTSSHRGHGDAIAKGFAAIRPMTDEQLRARVPGPTATTRADLLEGALEEHVYRVIAELFGKDEGYCRGRGGGMHIGDFSTGNLGANAIVGGSVPIATGAAMAHRYEQNDKVVCCFAGDGAFANGVVLESLNWAAQAPVDEPPRRRSCPRPADHLLHPEQPLRHDPSTDDEVMGMRHLARRAAGFASNNMHAEVVNGMDVLAVRDAVRRAAALCRAGDGPVLIEASTYRYYGHSLSDPRNEYRTREEEAAWQAVDPIEHAQGQLVDAGVADEAGVQAVERVRRRPERPGRAARRAGDRSRPRRRLDFLYTDGTPRSCRPPPATSSVRGRRPPRPSRTGSLQDAIREALVEEMTRDNRVLFYGEDVADYGGAFKLTKGLLETFGRERVFNTPISEAAICGTAVGAAIVGLRPVVELMYMDFALMASDQIANQAAKWHYMSGGQVEVPLVIRASVGAGKGYGGQHSQSLESLFTHLPGLWVVYPSTAADVKGLLKAAIRTNNPVLFVESQALYATRGLVPDGPDYVVPIGGARVARDGAGRDARGMGTGGARRPCRCRPARVGGRRHRRGHRPPEPRSARHGDRPRVCSQDRPLRRGQPGRALGLVCERDRGPRSKPKRSTTSTPRRPGSAQSRHLAPGRDPRAGVPARRRRHLRRPWRLSSGVHPPLLNPPRRTHRWLTRS